MPSAPTNGQEPLETLFNVRIQTWMNIVTTIGLPSVFLGLVIYAIGWKLAPPVVDGHIQFLGETSKTLENMATVQKKIGDSVKTLNESVVEVARIEKQSEAFMEMVHEEHVRQESKIDQVSTDLKESCKEICEALKGLKAVPRGPGE